MCTSYNCQIINYTEDSTRTQTNIYFNSQTVLPYNEFSIKINLILWHFSYCRNCLCHFTWTTKTYFWVSSWCRLCDLRSWFLWRRVCRVVVLEYEGSYLHHLGYKHKPVPLSAYMLWTPNLVIIDIILVRERWLYNLKYSKYSKGNSF